VRKIEINKEKGFDLFEFNFKLFVEFKHKENFTNAQIKALYNLLIGKKPNSLAIAKVNKKIKGNLLSLKPLLTAENIQIELNEFDTEDK